MNLTITLLGSANTGLIGGPFIGDGGVVGDAKRRVIGANIVSHMVPLLTADAETSQMAEMPLLSADETSQMAEMPLLTADANAEGKK